jgi:hypothetical protein
VFANVSSNDLTMLRVALCQDPLDQVVAILVAGNVDQGNARSVDSSLTNAVKVATQEITASDLQTLFNYLGSVLVHAVLGSISDDMINGTTAICWGAVLTDVLDTPITELAMSDNVNVGKNLLDARALGQISMQVYE